MKKTLLKPAAVVALLLFGLSQSWAQTANADPATTNTNKDDADVVTTVTKVLETTEDDATIQVDKGTVSYKFFVGKQKGTGSKATTDWTLKESKTVSADTGAGAGMPPKAKKQTLSSKGSYKIKVEMTVDSKSSASLSKGKV